MSVIARTERPMTSPHWTGVPISFFRSMTMVLAPPSAAALPAPLPAGPEPTTSTSQFCQSILTTRISMKGRTNGTAPGTLDV